ncbi:uncharacterized protein F4822DRAFT_77537 [Hypoxylon trugodes]|uniref:uncharacterized protein n=1 Tax=Hypoxylon trugodes TaxID=326681 RepID=UPI002192C264|nr:uncharacterized protein F4822DRAFT_77537 [Hypoxylon trugodes]KAI1383432.1 hypothetical protein F4822DRAFT_77537 [Hypoxylon trugodes]
MNVAVDAGRKFDDWPDESQWTPAPMFTSPFAQSVPIADTQFWTSPGHNTEEYYEPDHNPAQQELGRSIDASDNFDSGFTIDNAAAGAGGFMYNHPPGTQPVNPQHFGGSFGAHRRHDRESDALYDGSVASSSVGAPTIHNKFSSKSPEAAKFSPQSATGVSPASGTSSINWMHDDNGAIDHLSPGSPASNINVNVGFDPLIPLSTAPTPAIATSAHPIKSRRNRERNRVAAHKCRQKAKQSMSDLQSRERELSQQNRVLQEHAGSLRDEILDLKDEILRHSECNSDIIQNYIAKAARDVN